MSEQSAAETVIEVEDLVTHYGDTLILKGVTLNIRAGEIMVIMGGSGSGKSTLLRSTGQPRELSSCWAGISPRWTRWRCTTCARKSVLRFRVVR